MADLKYTVQQAMTGSKQSQRLILGRGFLAGTPDKPETFSNKLIRLFRIKCKTPTTSTKGILISCNVRVTIDGKETLEFDISGTVLRFKTTTKINHPNIKISNIRIPSSYNKNFTGKIFFGDIGNALDNLDRADVYSYFNVYLQTTDELESPTKIQALDIVVQSNLPATDIDALHGVFDCTTLPDEHISLYDYTSENVDSVTTYTLPASEFATEEWSPKLPNYLSLSKYIDLSGEIDISKIPDRYICTIVENPQEGKRQVSVMDLAKSLKNDAYAIYVATVDVVFSLATTTVSPIMEINHDVAIIATDHVISVDRYLVNGEGRILYLTGINNTTRVTNATPGTSTVNNANGTRIDDTELNKRALLIDYFPNAIIMNAEVKQCLYINNCVMKTNISKSVVSSTWSQTPGTINIIDSILTVRTSPINTEVASRYWSSGRYIPRNFSDADGPFRPCGVNYNFGQLGEGYYISLFKGTGFGPKSLTARGLVTYVQDGEASSLDGEVNSCLNITDSVIKIFIVDVFDSVSTVDSTNRSAAYGVLVGQADSINTKSDVNLSNVDILVSANTNVGATNNTIMVTEQPLDKQPVTRESQVVYYCNYTVGYALLSTASLIRNPANINMTDCRISNNIPYKFRTEAKTSTTEEKITNPLTDTNGFSLNIVQIKPIMSTNSSPQIATGIIRNTRICDCPESKVKYVDMGSANHRIALSGNEIWSADKSCKHTEPTERIERVDPVTSNITVLCINENIDRDTQFTYGLSESSKQTIEKAQAVKK